MTSGFTAFYLFLYCIHYFMTKLHIEDAASTFLYFGYTLIMVFLFFLLTGKFYEKVGSMSLHLNLSFRYHWFLRLFLVRSKNLQCCQGRLKPPVKRVYYLTCKR